MRVTVTARVGELVLRASEIESLEVQQEVGSHHHCFLSFYRATTLRLEELLGEPLTVTLEDELGSATPFEGEVVSGSQSHLAHGDSHFTLEGVSLSARMQLHRNTAYFPESTLADVAGALGASMVGSAGGPRLDYVQHGESDWDFLVRIADDAGCMVRPDGARAEVRAGFADVSHELAWGTNLLALTSHCRPVNHGFKGAVYQVADKRDHRFHGVRKAPPLTGGAPTLVAAARRLATRVGGGGDPNVDESVSRAPRLADFKTALERESARALGAAVLLEGASTHIGVTAGDTVRMAEATDWRAPFTGSFGVVRVTHRFDGQQYANEFSATPWAAYTLARRPSRRTVEGLVTAEVTANLDPKRLGRVRVRYRWQDEGWQTGWVRVAVPHAGASRGSIFTPEVGDEVLVGFEHGDPERPYVVGSLWNGKDVAPQTPEVKRIVTRSGNTMQLVDTAGKEMVEIFSPQGKCLLQLATDVGGTPTLTIHSEGDVSIEAKGEIRLSCARLVEKVGGDAAREVKGDSTLKVSGKATVKADGDVAVAAGANAVLVAARDLNAHGGGVTRVVGSMVHLNPPGAAAPRVQPRIPTTPASAWEKKE
ncbi:MAG TPA: phage baseplate assembly protein V, partial [Longimicrobium sp.]|nr:phage baseplate assembly protein V [Longimicrobium sp.]